MLDKAALREGTSKKKVSVRWTYTVNTSKIPNNWFTKSKSFQNNSLSQSLFQIIYKIKGFPNNLLNQSLFLIIF